MKKTLLLILLAFNLCFSQTGIEIRLVNASVGGMYPNTTPPYTLSNDTGLNLILQNHNAYTYNLRGGYPLPGLTNRIMYTECSNCNGTNFLNDLIAYNSVIESASYADYNYFSDAIYSRLTDGTIGVPTGLNSNNIITTNDAGLNQIFVNHNVYYYTQASTTTTNPDLLKTYIVVCNCDATLLRNDLNAYNTVINLTEYINPSYLLNSKNFNKKETIVYPNPFQSIITIDTDFAIKNYTVIDLIGKKIIETESKDELNTELAKLNLGTYLLQLQSEDNNIVTKKIIKN
ncbi:T9SS type A sorting domain-containing protein [uncultured Flavobacterium sp.]|uniref:T9SS type A sorting domain-containing protein n=1 Tax=uncultured Flavobacterium sp. TaxID=165435 RepID=UPI0030EE6F85|tara:strand:+ start:39657 stop:40520 length:864 start_codon:yes stop_codon:yes gene_type:complete